MFLIRSGLSHVGHEVVVLPPYSQRSYLFALQLLSDRVAQCVLSKLCFSPGLVLAMLVMKLPCTQI